MVTKEEKVTRITTRINERLDKEANDYVRQANISKNALINLALQEYLNKQKGRVG